MKKILIFLPFLISVFLINPPVFAASCSAVSSSKGCGAGGECGDTEICSCAVPPTCSCTFNADCAQNPGDETVGTPVNPNSDTQVKTGSCISCSSVGSSCSYYGESGVCNYTYGTYCGPGESTQCMKMCCVKKSGIYDNETRADEYKSNMPDVTDYGYAGPVFTSFTDVVAPVAKVMYYAALTIGVGAVILAGYMLMTSEGNPDRVKQGQEQLTAAILGVLFILLSAAILRIIIGTFFGLGF